MQSAFFRNSINTQNGIESPLPKTRVLLDVGNGKPPSTFNSSIIEDYQHKTPLEELPLADAMRAAVYEVGPRVYNVDLKGKSKVRILFVGCPGQGKSQDKDKKSDQEQVAALLKKLKEENDEDTYIIAVGLGDYVYDYGTNDPSDPAFDHYFHDIYENTGLKYLLALGNHDASRCEKAYLYNKYVKKMAIGDEVSINEVAHTYHPGKEQTNDYISPEEKETKQKEKIRQTVQIFQEEELDLDKVASQWIMPFFFGAYIFGDTQLFILDSNTFGEDFLNYYNDKQNPNKPNQFAWLLAEYNKAKAAGKKIVFAQHQFLFTNGKRLEKTDSHHYVEDNDFPELNVLIRKLTLLSLVKEHLSESKWKELSESIQKASYEKILETCKNYFSSELIDIFQQNIPADTTDFSELVGRMLDILNLHPDFLACAHDHYMCYYNNKKDPTAKRTICQFTCGGGGGHKQEQKSLIGHPYATTHSGYGVGELIFAAVKPQEFKINMYTLEDNGLRLSFTDADHLPKHDVVTDNPKLEALRARVLKICNQFLNDRRALEVEAKKKQASPKSTSYSFAHYLPSMPFFSGSKKEEENVENISSLSQLGSLFKPLKPIVKPIFHFMGFGDHFSEEIKCVNNLLAFFQQPVTPSMEVLVNYLQKTIKEMPAKNIPGSLFDTFKQCMEPEKFKAAYGVDLERSRSPIFV